MKKIISVLLLIALVCSSCALFGCALTDAFRGKVDTTYNNPEKYTAGNAEFEGTVDSFHIWWIHGSVSIKTHKENTVKIEESANKAIDDTFRLHWRYFYASDYGNVLYIYYSASGKFDYGDLKKDITVYLPEQDDMDLSVESQTAAVDVDFSTFENTLESISVLNYSGKVSVKVDHADEVRISGQNDEGIAKENREFSFHANGTVYDLGISASYASINASAMTVKNGDVGTVFADLVFSANEAENLKLSNSDGEIRATVLAFDSLDIETCYKPCELALSPEASFVLTIKEKDRFRHKMSPEWVLVDFAGVTQSGAQYTVGTGTKEIAVATSSTLHIFPTQA